MHNVKTRADTICFSVYCTHTHYSKEEFVGNVEPYFACFAPSGCPKLQMHCKTENTKKLFFK